RARTLPSNGAQLRLKPAAHDRNSTDSRWNVLNARNSDAPAYTQVEAKMSAIELQRYVPLIISLQTRLVLRTGINASFGVSSTPGIIDATAGITITKVSGVR